MLPYKYSIIYIKIYNSFLYILSFTYIYLLIIEKINLNPQKNLNTLKSLSWFLFSSNNIILFYFIYFFVDFYFNKKFHFFMSYHMMLIMCMISQKLINFNIRFCNICFWEFYLYDDYYLFFCFQRNFYQYFVLYKYLQYFYIFAKAKLKLWNSLWCSYILVKSFVCFLNYCWTNSFIKNYYLRFCLD